MLQNRGGPLFHSREPQQRFEGFDQFITNSQKHAHPPAHSQCAGGSELYKSITGSRSLIPNGILNVDLVENEQILRVGVSSGTDREQSCFAICVGTKI